MSHPSGGLGRSALDWLHQAQEEGQMSAVWIGALVLIGFVLWGATLFRRGRIVDREERHETRRERRRLHHKIKSSAPHQ
jgi:hypothetical protein